MRRFLTLLVTLLVFGAGTALGQVKQVSGVVTSADDKQPIPGASVFVKEAPTIGTTTDMDGKYTLKNIPANGKTLVFRFVGYQTTEVRISGSQINATLQSETQKIEEVVVTGYGIIKKSSFTGAAAKVESKTIAKTTDADVMKSLQSNVPGMQLNVTSGQPGAANTVNIRGLGSMNAGTQPLYVIDGVPIATGTFGMRSGESQTISLTFFPLSSRIEFGSVRMS